MAIRRETLVYDGPGGPFEGVAAWDDAVSGERPGVLVIPNVLGQKEQDNVTAERLAAMGYVALAADVFGQGRRKTRESENVAEYMNELNADRALLRERLRASHDALKGLALSDPSRTAAIGFCFGGKCVLDLARSGADVAAVVSFHGLYDAPPFPNAAMTAKVLVCHGWDDPLAPPESVVALGKELTEAGVDWQVHAYGHTGHGFTDESAGSGRPGFGYQADSARRSWAAMAGLLGEVFG